LFQPYGLNHTFVEGQDKAAPELARSYDIAGPVGISLGRKVGLFHKDQKILRADGLVDISKGQETTFNAWPGPAGAVASTAEDLQQFVLKAILTSKETVMEDQANFLEGNAEQDQFGWSGGSWGISSLVWTSPSREVTASVIANTSGDVFDLTSLFRLLVQEAIRADNQLEDKGEKPES